MHFRCVVAALIACTAVLVLTTCGTSGLAFREDTSVEILSPKSRSIVDLPLDLRWKLNPGSRSVHSFGVFVDRGPMPPGRTMAHLAKDDEVCRRISTCPDEAWLSARNIYTTRSTSLTVAALPDTRDERDPGREAHEVTIVLLDEAGMRIGESAFFVEFFFDRDRSG